MTEKKRRGPKRRLEPTQAMTLNLLERQAALLTEVVRTSGGSLSDAARTLIDLGYTAYRRKLASRV